MANVMAHQLRFTNQVLTQRIVSTNSYAAKGKDPAGVKDARLRSRERAGW